MPPGKKGSLKSSSNLAVLQCSLRGIVSVKKIGSRSFHDFGFSKRLKAGAVCNTGSSYTVKTGCSITGVQGS